MPIALDKGAAHMSAMHGAYLNAYLNAYLLTACCICIEQTATNGWLFLGCRAKLQDNVFSQIADRHVMATCCDGIDSASGGCKGGQAGCYLGLLTQPRHDLGLLYEQELKRLEDVGSQDGVVQQPPCHAVSSLHTPVVYCCYHHI